MLFKKTIRNPNMTSGFEMQRFQTHSRSCKAFAKPPAYPSMTTLQDKASENMPQCLHKYEMKPATSTDEVVCKPAHHPTYSDNRRLLDK